jgi:N-acetylglucosaminyl-diphospho-decaprenol L-rhamnosyltransferase
MTFNQITIVITTYKSENKIIKCLESIDKNCKILVIENSNNKDLKNRIEKNFKNVECILAGKNLGYAKGNNLGLSKVKTSYALIINPDAILQKETINNFFKTANKIKDFAIIGPAIQDEKNLTNNLNNLTEVNSIKGFAMFLNIKEFKNIGFFDENFFIYLEEIDLCRRLKKNNKKIYVDPTILIAHQGGSSHEEEYNFEMELSRNWHWMWSTFYFKKKYNGYFFALSSVFGKIISSIVKYIFYFFLHNKRKRLIYKHRFLGLYNSILGKPSWYRPHNN